MNTTKTLLTAILVMASATTVLGAKKKPVVQQPLDPNEKVAYLFTYFNSNDPKDEQICYALSEDGYNYTPINDGMPVIESDTIAFTQCVRDPHILRGEDGKVVLHAGYLPAVVDADVQHPALGVHEGGKGLGDDVHLLRAGRVRLWRDEDRTLEFGLLVLLDIDPVERAD